MHLLVRLARGRHWGQALYLLHLVVNCSGVQGVQFLVFLAISAFGDNLQAWQFGEYPVFLAMGAFEDQVLGVKLGSILLFSLQRIHLRTSCRGAAGYISCFTCKGCNLGSSLLSLQWVHLLHGIQLGISCSRCI